MSGKLDISNYLDDVFRDWQTSLAEFPKNTSPTVHWPIPFFGNPATALVATVGVNPSSGEFTPDRHWPETDKKHRKAWKTRLKDYFNHSTPAYDWFGPWRIGLALLDCSYEAGTAAHFDVSYRSTKAMFKNRSTDLKEFRRMVERDVHWFFKLLVLCPKLRVLLTMGPIVGTNAKRDSLLAFLHEFAPRHGFRMFRQGTLWQLWHEASRKILVVHDADTPDEKCITCRVVKNLHVHRDNLRQRLV